MKKVKFLLPILATALLLAMSSVSCASNVKGKMYKHESEDATISFTTKSDCIYTYKIDGIKGTYKVEKKKITCAFKNPDNPNETITIKFDIVNAKKLKGEDGKFWNKV